MEKLPLAGKTLESIERNAIAQTLEQCGGNKTKAAKQLGISPSTLYEKVKKYKLSRVAANARAWCGCARPDRAGRRRTSLR